jgi:hypothetical protein
METKNSKTKGKAIIISICAVLILSLGTITAFAASADTWTNDNGIPDGAVVSYDAGGNMLVTKGTPPADSIGPQRYAGKVGMYAGNGQQTWTNGDGIPDGAVISYDANGNMLVTKGTPPADGTGIKVDASNNTGKVGINAR